MSLNSFFRLLQRKSQSSRRDSGSVSVTISPKGMSLISGATIGAPASSSGSSLGSMVPVYTGGGAGSVVIVVGGGGSSTAPNAYSYGVGGAGGVTSSIHDGGRAGGLTPNTYGAGSARLTAGASAVNVTASHVREAIQVGGTGSSANTSTGGVHQHASTMTANGSGTITLSTPYEPYFPSFAKWLPAVQRRIQNATIPDGYCSLAQNEWISEAVNSAATRFFDATADVLPSEPFLYGSKSGALIAEFSTQHGALTTVISPDTTTLFGVRDDQPENPIQTSIKRGSNTLRETLKDIVQTLSASSHGQMGSSQR